MSRLLAAFFGALTLAALAGAAHGHGEPLPLAVWGDFTASTARCQRALGRAVAGCAREVWAAQRACLEPQLRGAPCDVNARALAIRAARDRALDRVEAWCSDEDATRLQFLGVREALSDVTSACRQLERELVTAVYGPALVGGFEFFVVSPLRPESAACVANAAQRADEVLRVSDRERRTPLDRIATRLVPLERKLSLIARAGARRAQAATHATRRAAAACPADRFAALYGRPLETLLTDLAARADCLIDGVYVQDAIACPAPRCGNGMQEAGEECDDGNSDDADACRGDCTLGDCVVYPNTFDLLQDAIFDGRGCTTDACHGADAGGGLDLQFGSAYDNLVGVPATSTAQARVAPGDPEASRLWLLLAKATLGRVDVPGRAMPPPGEGDPLTADELEALQLWIAGGAPRGDTVAGTGALLGACLPPPPAERK